MPPSFFSPKGWGMLTVLTVFMSLALFFWVFQVLFVLLDVVRQKSLKKAAAIPTPRWNLAVSAVKATIAFLYTCDLRFYMLVPYSLVSTALMSGIMATALLTVSKSGWVTRG